MPKSVTVTLDGKEYTITEKQSRENAAWRKLLEEPFKELAALLESAPGIDIKDGQSLAALVRSTSGMLLGSIDTVRELVVAYAPDLPLDYDSEIIDVFSAILGLAYPFGSILGKLGHLIALGSQAKQTAPSLPSQPGADGMTS